MSRSGTTDERAFRELIEAYRAPLQRLCGGYEHDAARREELHQEILLALWRALPAYRGEASKRTFVFRVAHNVATTHVRRARRERGQERPFSEGLEDHTSGADEALDRQSRVEELLGAIRRLPNLDRQIVMLYLEELSQQEIASVVGLSQTNVSTRLLRAKQRLKSWVSGARHDR